MLASTSSLTMRPLRVPLGVCCAVDEYTSKLIHSLAGFEIQPSAPLLSSVSKFPFKSAFLFLFAHAASIWACVAVTPWALLCCNRGTVALAVAEGRSALKADDAVPGKVEFVPAVGRAEIADETHVAGPLWVMTLICVVIIV